MENVPEEQKTEGTCKFSCELALQLAARIQ